MKKKDRIQLANFFKVLSNPHRLHIFQKCLSCCPDQTVCSSESYRACVGDLSEGLNIAPSTVSHHIKELSHAGLLKMERSGKHIYCGLSKQNVAALQSLMSSLWAK